MLVSTTQGLINNGCLSRGLHSATNHHTPQPSQLHHQIVHQSAHLLQWLRSNQVQIITSLVMDFNNGANQNR